MGATLQGPPGGSMAKVPFCVEHRGQTCGVKLLSRDVSQRFSTLQSWGGHGRRVTHLGRQFDTPGVNHLLGLIELLVVEFPSKKQRNKKDIKILLPEFLASLASGVFDYVLSQQRAFCFCFRITCLRM